MESINFWHLEDILEERGMNKYQLSELTDYSPTTIYRVLSREQRPSLKFVYCVIDKLNLDRDEIIKVFFPGR